MAVINLTQHKATKEQRLCGVFDLEETKRQKLCTLLTFDNPPSEPEMEERAKEIASIASHEMAYKALIGGAPFFMPHLELALKDEGITPLYSFSKRVIEEEKNENGEVVKKSRFKHEAFIGAQVILMDDFRANPSKDYYMVEVCITDSNGFEVSKNELMGVYIPTFAEKMTMSEAQLTQRITDALIDVGERNAYVYDDDFKKGIVTTDEGKYIRYEDNFHTIEVFLRHKVTHEQAEIWFAAHRI